MHRQLVKIVSLVAVVVFLGGPLRAQAQDADSQAAARELIDPQLPQRLALTEIEKADARVADLRDEATARFRFVAPGADRAHARAVDGIERVS